VGWRGLLAGVLRGAVRAMLDEGATILVAGLGPCIGPCCYEFGPHDLASVTARCGGAAVGVTSEGRPALDLAGALAVVLERLGVPLALTVGGCTACGDDAFSFRAHGDEARQALLVWRDDIALGAP
jgi:polyphenol oxidase